jgi:hypothetical protein
LMIFSAYCIPSIDVDTHEAQGNRQLLKSHTGLTIQPNIGEQNWVFKVETFVDVLLSRICYHKKMDDQRQFAYSRNVTLSSFVLSLIVSLTYSPTTYHLWDILDENESEHYNRNRRVTKKKSFLKSNTKTFHPDEKYNIFEFLDVLMRSVLICAEGLQATCSRAHHINSRSDTDIQNCCELETLTIAECEKYLKSGPFGILQPKSRENGLESILSAYSVAEKINRGSVVVLYTLFTGDTENFIIIITNVNYLVPLLLFPQIRLLQCTHVSMMSMFQHRGIFMSENVTNFLDTIKLSIKTFYICKSLVR